jgi:Transglutaminase-like superfamily/Coenzyme PQQ synthesis protein D (PqqD)
MATPSRKLTPSPEFDWNQHSAFLVRSPDGGLIFDLDHNRFRKLDPIGTEMWSLLSCGMAEDEVSDILARRFNIETAIIAADLKSLLAAAAKFDLSPARVLISDQPNPLVEKKQPSFPWYGQDVRASRPKTSTFSVLKAFFGLLWFDRVLSRQTLKHLCQRVNNWPVKIVNGSIDPQCIGRICASVERACVWHRKPAVCLQRSAVTTCLLRNEGVEARMIIASKVMPLEPHAWVEVDSCPVNDFPKVSSLYLRFVSL